MKRLLVTGVTGFIGAHCLRLILEGGYDEIHAVSRSRQGPAAPKLAWHAADLRVAAEAMREAWSYLQAKGTSKGIEVPQYKGMHELMGFPEVWDFEKRWVS